MSKTKNRNYDEVRKNLFETIEGLPEEECKELFEEVVDMLFQKIKNSGTAKITVKNGTTQFSERELANLLTEIGIPVNIKGYNYLKIAIMYYADYKQKNGTGCKMVKGVYNYVTKHFDSTSPSKVERAIRNAIIIAFKRGNFELLDDIFGYTVDAEKGKPTNSEFIAMIAEYMTIKA